MDEQRFFRILDRLNQAGFSLTPFNDKMEIFEGNCGSFIRGWPVDNENEQLLIFIARRDFSFEIIESIQKLFKQQLYIIQRDCLACFDSDALNVGVLDDSISRCIKESQSYFGKPGDRVKRIAWSTDIHLNFLEDNEVTLFIDRVADYEPDVWMITGDIAEAHNFAKYMHQIEDRLQKPVCFVLGNHDFYGGSIKQARSIASAICRKSPYLFWMPEAGTLEITSEIAIVGHGCWGDARHGDFENSVKLNDHLLIKDFIRLDRKRLQKKLNILGDEAAEHFARLLPKAFEQYQHLILLTHCPPFVEASLYYGRPSGDEWKPHFTCKAVGDVLIDSMKAHPEKKLSVLCGHTHGAAVTRPLENLLVLTGNAEYGAPSVLQIFEIPL